MKTELLQIRIEPELKAEIEKRAKEQDRTLSNYVLRVLKAELRKPNK